MSPEDEFLVEETRRVMASARKDVDVEHDLKALEMSRGESAARSTRTRVALLSAAALLLVVGALVVVSGNSSPRVQDAQVTSEPSESLGEPDFATTPTTPDPESTQESPADSPGEPDEPSLGNASRVEINVDRVAPDGTIEVDVDCFANEIPELERSPLLLIDFVHDGQQQSMVVEPTSVEWNENGGYSATIDLRQQVAPGPAQLLAGCDSSGAFPAEFTVTDYAEGASWTVAEPVDWSLTLSSGKPFVEVGGVMTVWVECPGSAGVGGGHVAVYRFADPAAQVAFVGGERIALYRAEPEAYAAGEDGSLTFELEIPVSDALVGENYVRPSCISRPSADPPSRHFKLQTQSILVTVEPST